MSRYIKFDDAVKIMACEMYAEAQSQGYDVDGIEDFMPEAKAWIADAPSIDIDIEPKRGEWKIEDAENAWGYMLTCSECGDTFRVTENALPHEHFCRNCGADMRGKDDEC